LQETNSENQNIKISNSKYINEINILKNKNEELEKKIESQSKLIEDQNEKLSKVPDLEFLLNAREKDIVALQVELNDKIQIINEKDQHINNLNSQLSYIATQRNSADTQMETSFEGNQKSPSENTEFLSVLNTQETDASNNQSHRFCIHLDEYKEHSEWALKNYKRKRYNLKERNNLWYHHLKPILDKLDKYLVNIGELKNESYVILPFKNRVNLFELNKGNIRIDDKDVYLIREALVIYSIKRLCIYFIYLLVLFFENDFDQAQYSTGLKVTKLGTVGISKLIIVHEKVGDP
jgi:chromosome segregation ATPase